MYINILPSNHFFPQASQQKLLLMQCFMLNSTLSVSYLLQESCKSCFRRNGWQALEQCSTIRVLPSTFYPFCTPFEGQTGLLHHDITVFSHCHFLSPLGMLSFHSNCSQTFITAIWDENPHEIRTHYASHTACGETKHKEKKVTCLRSNKVSVTG